MASLPKRSGDGDILISMRANEYRSKEVKKGLLSRMHITSMGVRLTTLALTMLWTQKALCINVLSETCQKLCVQLSYQKAILWIPNAPINSLVFSLIIWCISSCCCCFWFGTVYIKGFGQRKTVTAWAAETEKVYYKVLQFFKWSILFVKVL